MEQIILRLVAKNDGKLSWYELDRALMSQGVDPSTLGSMMPTLKQLQKDGLIRPEGAGPQPRYWITDAGKSFL